MTGRRATTLMDGASTRNLFHELVSEARDELGQRPSPSATGYLVDLLEARVRNAAPEDATPESPAAPATLAESLVEALLADGSSRWTRLRALGDRALFDAGFFGESLRGRAIGIDYYADIGRTAYLRISAAFEPGAGSRVGGPNLFEELARHFVDFVELLDEVGQRARGDRCVDLLGLYDRYRESGSQRDRARLLRRGLILPRRGAAERVQ